MPIDVITANMDRTVGKAEIKDNTHIGVYDIHVLKEWIKELDKITPYTDDGGRKKKVVSLSFVEKDTFYRRVNLIALCGQPVMDLSENLIEVVFKDKAIVAASYCIKPEGI